MEGSWRQAGAECDLAPPPNINESVNKGAVMSENNFFTGRVFQINISPGGVPKLPVRQAVLNSLGLEGDDHRSKHVHGGPERALCLYALERIQALQAEGHPVFAGAMGENLTLSGIDWEGVSPGVQMQIGKDVLIEITRYTTPCANLIDCFVGGRIERVLEEKNPGWSRLYARVLQEGEIWVGDPVSFRPAVGSVS
jgi:MOSC domain-containing protein YiiM